MVRKCTVEDRDRLTSYLKEEAVYNTFLLADIDDFGFEEPFQTVYADEDEGEIRGVYLCFYQNFLLYSKENRVNIPFLKQLFATYTPDVIMGKYETVQELKEVLQEYALDARNLYLLDHKEELEDETVEGEHAVKGCGDICRAGSKDVDDIFAFLQSIDELKGLYTSRQMIADRIEKKCGVHYIIRKDGEIIAHANSAAGCEVTMMIGGVGVAPKYRKQGLGGRIVSRLCRDILAEGKHPCLFSMQEEAHSLYKRIGFKKAGVWGTLTKPAEKKAEIPSEHEPKELPSYIPIYNQLYEDIINGIYKTGSLLPSENVLSEKYKVSRNTLRQALTILNQDGYIYKRQGKGTFVSYDSEKKQKDKIYNFLSEDALEEIVRIKPEYNFGKPTRIAQIKLELSEGEEVLASNNVYESVDGPIGQSFLQVPVKVLKENQIDPGSEEQLVKFMDKGVYCLADSCKLMAQLMEADDQVIPFLKVERGTPLLHFEQLLFDKHHRPIARIKYYFSSGKYQIECRW